MSSPRALPSARPSPTPGAREPRQWFTALLIPAAAFFAGLAVAALSARWSLMDTVDRARSLGAALDTAAALRGQVLNLERAQRGYLLTGDDDTLAEFHQTLPRVRDAVAQLRPLGERYDDIRPLLLEIRENLAVKQGELQSSLALYRLHGPEAALSLLRSDVGRQVSDRLNVAADNLRARLLVHLANEQRTLDRMITVRTVTLTVTTIAGLFVCLMALNLLRRQGDAQQRAREAERRALQSQRESREKSRFLAHMSHEIRTPINAIFGFAQLLADGVRAPRDREYVDSILASGRSLLALINDILDMSRIEAGKLEIRPAPMSLREAVDAVLVVFAHSAHEKQLSLRAEIDDSVPPALMLDAGRVRQMLLNLVGNAVKFTTQGAVTVRAWARPGNEAELPGLCIEVVDTGIGIAPDDLERVFEPFEQIDSESRQEGTGLGLEITRRLARLMGGEISVRSEPSRGSAFRIDLPLLPGRGPAPRAGAGRGGIADLPRMRVLIVDGDDLSRRLLAGLFAGGAHEVALADSLDAAQRLARETAFDLALVEWPGSAEPVREALRPTRGEPACLLLATVHIGDDELAIAARDCDGAVRKPVGAVALHAELVRVLRAHQRLSGDAEGEDATDDEREISAEDREHARRALTRCFDELRELRRTMSMRELSRFAQTLLRAAEDAGEPALLARARELDDALRAFDVPRTESVIAALTREGGA